MAPVTAPQKKLAARLRGRSAHELYVRGMQAVIALLERQGIGGDVAPPLRIARNRSRDGRTAPRVLEHLRTTLGHAFPAWRSPSLVAALIRRQYPLAAKELVGRADAVCRGSFDLLGYTGLSFGAPIDWHRDPIAGLSAPRSHWSRVPYLDASIVGDHKIVWELNRHAHLVTLAQAYLLTNDARYSATIAAHLDQWIDANPPKDGINWASSLEVAFRSIAWIWVLGLVGEALPEATRERALSILEINARHLARNLSTYFSPNTHLTGEALGLLYLGSALIGTRDAEKWRRQGRAILEQQLPRQVRDDGTYFEQSTYYQRYTADFYLHALLLARATSLVPADATGARAERLFDVLAYLTRGDGTIPLIGDDDGGQLLRLDARRLDDCTATLAAGAVVFARGDLAASAGPMPEGAIWLLGGEGLAAFDALSRTEPAARNRDFADGGLAVIRSGWDAKADTLVFDRGVHGGLSAAHAHADALSFELTVDGQPLLVDPGTYTYMGGDRDRFRGTGAHNTLVVDGVDQSVSEPPFRWSTAAATTSTITGCADWFAVVGGEHDGYRRLPSPVGHARTIVALHGRGWLIHDVVSGDGRHDVRLGFHCAPAIAASVRGARSASLRSAGGSAATLSVLGASGELTTEADWVSRAYGAREAATVLRYSAVVTDATSIVTYIGRDAAAVDVRERSLRVSGARPHLVFHGPVDDATVSTDAAALWLDFDGDRPSAFVALGATRLRLGGATVFEHKQPGFVAARWTDGRWALIEAPTAFTGDC